MLATLEINLQILESFPFLPTIVSFIIVVTTFELYLDHRRRSRLYTRLSNEAKLIPKEFEGYITKEEAKKSSSYHLKLSSLSSVENLVNTLFMVTVLTFNLLDKLWIFSSSLHEKMNIFQGNELFLSCLYAFIYQHIQRIISLPFSIYSTFKIEAEFDFNNTTVGTFIFDQIKMTFLSIILGGPILCFIVYTIQHTGKYFWFWSWLVIIVIMLFLNILSPTIISIFFYKFTPLPETMLLKKLIDKFATEINFPLKEIKIMNGSKRSKHSNAFYYGLFKKKVAFFDSLFDHLESNGGFLAVLAHEFGHWKHNHLIKLFIKIAFETLCYFALFGLATTYKNGLFLLERFNFSKAVVQSNPTILSLTCFFMILSPLETLLDFVGKLISRKFEYQADRFATRLGYDLTTPLIKIFAKNLSDIDPDPLFSAYHATHPSLLERVRAIKKTIQSEKIEFREIDESEKPILPQTKENEKNDSKDGNENNDNGDQKQIEEEEKEKGEQQEEKEEQEEEEEIIEIDNEKESDN
ncbi:caax prenyl protease 1 [Anaeramoeba flamelloides]|uniref:Ste24 endopeptidase n=1 Tax=Anaeramoeba flamelloides TaxID=1746091 RepID=A0ABQ8Z4B7_9EUKA|nr:caax prenyl protease 1 [Anaeramoeba flamelloides]